MLNVRQVENDFVNQVTVTTVEVYEAVGGVKRIKDTFMIKIPGIHELRGDAMDELILAKLAEIGYTVDVTTQADGTIQSAVTDLSSGWIAPADAKVNPITDPNILPPDVVPTEEEAAAIALADPNLVGNTPV
jgi:hypothetical protein